MADTAKVLFTPPKGEFNASAGASAKSLKADLDSVGSPNELSGRGSKSVCRVAYVRTAGCPMRAVSVA